MFLSAMFGVASYFFGQPMAIELHWLWMALASACMVALSLLQFLRTRAVERRDDELRAIVDAVPHILFFKDVASRYQLLNAEFKRLLGYEERDVVGTTGDLVVGAGRNVRMRAQDVELLASGEARTYDEDLEIDGAVRNFQLRKQPVRDRRGKLLGLVGLAIDLTDHKRMVRDLEDAHQRLSLALEEAREARQKAERVLGELESSQADLELALATGDLGVWRSVTPAPATAAPSRSKFNDTPLQGDRKVWEFCGLGADARLSYGDLFGLLHPDDRVRTSDRIERAYAEGAGAYRDQFRIVGHDGVTRNLEMRGSVKTVAGSGGERVSISFTGIAKDVTEEEQLKADLSAKAEEARVALDAKRQFLATISHEVRTPLSGVLGMLDLLIDTPLVEGQRTMLARCRESSVALLAIINDILDFSKIEARKLDIESRPLSLASLIEDVCANLAPEAARKAIGLDVEIDAQLPEFILGDSMRLRQILTNLVGNAVKFTHRGRVKVEARRGADGRLQLEVEDTGIGIDSTTIDALFEPFRQADTTTARRYGGTGLGLTIVRQLVELMHGSVRCESELGRGSRFCIELPLQPWTPTEKTASSGDGDRVLRSGATAPALGTDAELALAGRGLRVLYAEDHEINREVTLMQLAKLGFACDVAQDGQEAWDILQSSTQPYAMLLTDCHMPRMDGYDLATRVRARESELGLPRLPIVALTANVSRADADRCLAMGMDACLTKPVPLATLRRALVDALALAGAPAGAATPAAPLPASPYPGLVELCGGRLAKVADLVRIFVATTTADLQAMDRAAEADDQARLRQLAHRLCSACNQLEEAQSVLALRAVERAGPADGAEGRRGLLALYAQARAELAAALARASEFMHRHAPSEQPG
jgi:PAS domain S-box-containing protein